jgi:hypothetical protein
MGQSRIRWVRKPLLGYGITNPLYDEFFLEWPPSTVVFQNTPQGDSKTTPYLLTEPWRAFIEKINSPNAYRWMTNVGNMVINPPQPYGWTRCESIMGGCNYFSFDAYTSTHVRVISYDYLSDPPSDIIVEENPHRIWKAAAVNSFGEVRNVGAGLDAYWPLMGRKPLWLHRDFVTLFPPGYDYKFRKFVEVWDENRPLLIYKNGIREFPNPNWKLKVPNVIPPRSAYI